LAPGGLGKLCVRKSGSVAFYRLLLVQNKNCAVFFKFSIISADHLFVKKIPILVSFLILPACGVMLTDITTNPPGASSPIINSAKVEDNTLTIGGQNLNNIQSIEIDFDGSSKSLLFQSQGATESVLVASETTQIPYSSTINFKMQTAEGEISQQIPAVFAKGSLPIKKVSSGADNDYLITDGDGVVKWSSSSLLSQLQTTELQAGSITGAAIELDSSELQLSGSVSTIKGSLLVGAGTSFTTQLQQDDTVLVGGKPVLVERVLSDTEFVAREPIQHLTHAKGYPDIEGIYFSDDRASDTTSTSLRIPLPQQAYPNWVVLIGSFTKRAGTGVSRSLTWNGNPLVVTETQDQDPIMADLWIVKGSSAADTAFTNLAFTGSPAGNMSLIAVVLTSASQSASQETHNGTGDASVDDSFSLSAGQRGFIIAMTDGDSHPAKGGGTALIEQPFIVGSKLTQAEYSVALYSTGAGDYGNSTYSIPFLQSATPAYIFFEVHVDGGSSMNMVRYRGGVPW
jgi:hypothetical protein